MNGHRLPIRNTTNEKAFLNAHAFRVHTSQAGGSSDEPGLVGAKTLTTLIGNGRTGVGTAVELRAIEGWGLGDTNRSSFVKGHDPGFAGRVNLTVHNLGGQKTAGSDCLDVILYSYVERHFRCTGVESTTLVLGIQTGASQECYEKALNLLDSAHRHALEVGNHSVNGPSWFTGADAQRAIDALTPGGETADPTEARQVDRVESYAMESAQIADEVLDLVTCVQADANVDVGLTSDQLDTVVDSVNDLTANGLNGTWENATLNATEALDSDLFLEGPPDWGVEVEVLADAARDGYLAAAGEDSLARDFGFGWALEEWTTELDTATVRLDQVDDGQDAEILDDIVGPLEDHVYEDDTTRTFDHDERYEIELEAADVRNETTVDAPEFLVDLQSPQFAWTTAPTDWVNDTYPVSVNVTDPASGPDSVNLTLEVETTDCCNRVQHNVSLDPNGEWANTTTEVDMGDVSTGDEVFASSAEAADAAGNTETTGLTQPAIDVDDPVAKGEVQTDLDQYVVEDPVRVDVGASDADSGLAEITVELVNQDTGAIADTHHEEDLEGPVDREVELSVDAPQATYDVVVTARDHAGNTAETTTDQAIVQLVPEMDLGAPFNGTQQMVPYDFRLQGETWIEGFPEEPVDVEATFETRDDGTEIANASLPNTTETFEHRFTDLDPSEGDHQLVVSATNGDIQRILTANMRVVERQDPLIFHNYTGYANLSAEDQQRWSLEIGRECDTGETLDLKVSLNQANLTLYLDDSAPEQAGTNPDTYAKNDTTNASDKQLGWNDVQAGDPFTVLVNATTEPSDQYRVAYWILCDGGSGGSSSSPSDPQDNIETTNE